MSWQSSTRDQIMFISPTNKFFTAKWKNNERSFEKKLGKFDPPKFSGTIIQDMGVTSDVYPLTVYFDGLTNQKDASDFYDALKKEKGQWEVVHPTKGSLVLQLVSVKEMIDPVGDGNFTMVDTQWLEPANVERIITPDELIIETLLSVFNAISDGITQLKQLRSDLYAAIQSGVNAINAIKNLTSSVTSTLSETDAITNDAINSVKNALGNSITKYQADPTGIDTVTGDDNITIMANALVDLISLPLNASTDFSTRFSVYSTLATSIGNLAPETTTKNDYNAVLMQEMAAVALLISISRIIVTSSFSTRAQIVSAMDNTTTIFNTVINNFEAVQSLFVSVDIDLQYFSQSTAYTSIQKMFSLTMQYLLSQFLNLKSENRFTLKKARSPLEIAVTEYGSLGDNDSNYDLFLTSNDLHGNDMLLLPAGREVVAYV